MEVFLISGVPGAGKSTVARSLAARLPRAAHIEGDLIHHELIVSGGVDPHEGPKDESLSQLRLRRRNICLLADSFAEAGFVPIIDDVVVSPSVLDLYDALLQTRPLLLVQLSPAREVVKARDAARHKQVFEVWGHLDEQLRSWTPRLGLWLDTSDMTVEETVATILDRREEAIVLKGEG